MMNVLLHSSYSNKCIYYLSAVQQIVTLYWLRPVPKCIMDLHITNANNELNIYKYVNNNNFYIFESFLVGG